MNQEIYSCIAAKFISTNASKTSLFIQRFQANNYGACFSNTSTMVMNTKDSLGFCLSKILSGNTIPDM
jgi:hypothetical protein